jgi:repressor LexA
MTEELTTAQRRILEFLELRASEGKTPPTYREICKRFGYRSPKAAADHIAALERKGILVRDKRHARGVSLVKDSSLRANLGRPAQ